MIELKNITVSLPAGGRDAATILSDIDLVIEAGEWVTLIGPNGSGKTTLLQTLAGLLPISRGELIADGLERRIALLLQEPDNQFVSSSVRNELILSLPATVDKPAGRERLSQAVDRFSLTRFLDRNPHRLSGGEKQRVAFATVWLSDPRLLLLDEPTSYLDSAERERCTRFVRELNDAGVSIVWAAPSRDRVSKTQRLVRIDDGRITFDGSHGDYDIADGGDNPESRVPKTGQIGEAIIHMESASFGYDERPVITDISVDLRQGECIAVTGPNGSGKSTLLGLLSGVLEPTTGEIQRVFKKPVSGGRQNLFYLFQNPERLLFADDVFGELAFGLRSLKIPRADIDQRVDEALTAVGLPPDEFRGRVPLTLSFGEMRRLALAIALALDPLLLLMDEPASCLDPSGRTILFNVIAQFKARGRTVVVASHDIGDVASLIDRVIELNTRE
jgi:energy-coupling factor transporter ATP-binding protein EcfA2